MGKRMLVCGGRNFAAREWLWEELALLVDREGVDTIIHGGARGADSLAGQYARDNGLKEIVFKADWNKYGNAAGHIRNKRMLVEGKPDIVAAFPGGKGTADMIRQAELYGVEVVRL